MLIGPIMIEMHSELSIEMPSEPEGNVLPHDIIKHLQEWNGESIIMKTLY